MDDMSSQFKIDPTDVAARSKIEQPDKDDMSPQFTIDLTNMTVRSKIDQVNMGFRSGFYTVFDDVEVIQKRFNRVYKIISKETSYYDDFLTVGHSLYSAIENFKSKK